jgi:hypothetical protein
MSSKQRSEQKDSNEEAETRFQKIMPQEIKHKRTTRRPGKGVRRRTERQTAIRSGRQEAAPAVKVIADSLYSLTLTEKSGLEVFKTKGLRSGNEVFSLDKFYDDVFLCFSNAKKILTGDKSFDASSVGLDRTMLISYILTDFKKMLPEGWEYNIDHDRQTDRFYFTIYKECQWWNALHTFPVGPLLQHLKKKNLKLHNLFLQFLKLLRQKVGIELWTDGFMDNTLEYMKDNAEEMAAELDPEDPDDVKRMKEYNDAIRKYTHGEPALYQELIKKAKATTPDKLSKAVSRFRGPIKEIIQEGCGLMSNRIYDYYYFPDGMDVFTENTFLELDGQVLVLWDFDDLATEHEHSLDAMASEGVQSPVISYRVDHLTKKINFNQLKEKAEWPIKLSDFILGTPDGKKKSVQQLIQQYLVK